LIAEAFARMDETSDMGCALEALSGISQLGCTPFASKVVTKRHPEFAGILDTQLFKGLSRSTWARCAKFLRVGSVSDPRCQVAFQAWCEMLGSPPTQ